jgi:hypothetical protein
MRTICDMDVTMGRTKHLRLYLAGLRRIGDVQYVEITRRTFCWLNDVHPMLRFLSQLLGDASNLTN